MKSFNYSYFFKPKDNIVKLWSKTNTPLSKLKYQIKSLFTLQIKKFFTIFFIIFLFTNISKAADLKITEVFPYGKNERIEIYNNDEKDFSGNIELSGAKSKELKANNIYISSKKYIIIGDEWNIKINDVEILDKKGLSISDNSAIDIKLLIDGVVMDTFQVSKQDIVSTDKKNSFEKIFRGNDVIVKSVNKYSSNNILPGIQANPGIVHILGQGSQSNILQTFTALSQSKKIKKDSESKKKENTKTKQDNTKSKLSNLDSRENKLQEENTILKQKIKQSDSELALTKTSLNILSSNIKTNWQSIYYENGFEKIDNFYKIELLKIEKNDLSGSVFGQTYFKNLFESYEINNVEDLGFDLFGNILDFYFIQTYNDFINLLK